ncbi:MAG: agmatine deiminase family protein [Bacteroidetes bacterium]|nr:agmatine deiminase family protein [Bacteroidota bacterium]
MKKFYLTLLIFLIFPFYGISQAGTDNIPQKLTHWLSPGEARLKHLIGMNFVETDPPVAPVRNVAEFDRMQGALVRYPFGIPLTLVKEMANDLMVTTIVANSSQQNTVISQYTNAGVNLSNCNFLLAPSDSYWTRDYGPWFESDSANNIGIVDFPYNRPRPNDDEIPKKVADMLGIPWFGMNVIHTGGNYMTDGMGISSSTTLVIHENTGQDTNHIVQKMHDYLGINNYILVEDPNNTYIDHIDCWGKYLAPDKILIRKVLPSNPQYDTLEMMAAFYTSTTCSYGYPYRVFRVMTPQGQPYSNSVILNNKVLIPFMGGAYDDSAIAAYQNAMPGYQIKGFINTSAPIWESTDALHCRVMGIADVGLLYIWHVPISGNQPAENDYTVNASLIPCSDSSIYNDSVVIWYKVNDGPFIMKHMTNTSAYNYTGTIPAQPGGSTVNYYLYAADKSGRHATQPFIGAADPFTFNTVYTDLAAIPDTLWFKTYQDCTIGKVTTIHNYTSAAINLTNVEESGWPSSGGCMWYVDPVPVTNYPYLVNPGDSLQYRVKITFITGQPTMSFAIDTMHIETAIGNHHVIIMINDSLLVAIKDHLRNQEPASVICFPNPFREETRILIDLRTPSLINLEILDLNGSIIRNLMNRISSSNHEDISWNGTDESGNRVPAGIYFCRLKTNEQTVIKRLVRIR